MQISFLDKLIFDLCVLFAFVSKKLVENYDFVKINCMLFNFSHSYKCIVDCNFQD